MAHLDYSDFHTVSDIKFDIGRLRSDLDKILEKRKLLLFFLTCTRVVRCSMELTLRQCCRTNVDSRVRSCGYSNHAIILWTT